MQNTIQESNDDGLQIQTHMLTTTKLVGVYGNEL
jgi:hypothetical protein